MSDSVDDILNDVFQNNAPLKIKSAKEIAMESADKEINNAQEVKEESKKEIDAKIIDYTEIGVRFISLGRRITDTGKAKKYYAVLMPKKGIVSKDGCPIFYHKDVVIIDKGTNTKLNAVEQLAKENNGTVIRGDKALRFLEQNKVNVSHIFIMGKVENG